MVVPEENRTERWVKWGVGLALAAVGAVFSFAMNQQQRVSSNEKDIAIMQTRLENYGHERMELDSRIAALIQRLSDQHDQMLRLVGDEERRHTERTVPVFPNRYNR